MYPRSTNLVLSLVIAIASALLVYHMRPLVENEIIRVDLRCKTTQMKGVCEPARLPKERN